MAEIPCQLIRRLGEVQEFEQTVDLLGQQCRRVVVLKRNDQILPDTQRLEDARHLEFDADAAADTLEGFGLRHVLAVIDDPAARGRMFAENQAEEGALAGAVGADQAVDFTGFEREVNPACHMQAAEPFVEVAGFEKRHHAASFLARERRTCFATKAVSP